ncbi:MAG: M14 family zinc carboxypeptidase [Acidobacteriota bacterium]|nr:M14 family zinc carboxypeptidase [Acidobacteriota bacterium]MDH3525006.1 M14 family zinc carboxypeptidase [Acidobacteriota bacterium]
MKTFFTGVSRGARRPSRIGALATLVLVALLSPLAVAADDGAYAPDVAEPGSVEAIARFTTDPRFVNPWVAYVPESAAVPSPADYLGHVAGAAGELTGTAKLYGYLAALAAASPRVHLEEIGRTEEDRPILLVAVADEAGIAELPRLRAATAALADPRRTSPGRAEDLIATARPFYYVNAGLHADETGSSETVMELAYRLAVSEQPMIRRIRERLVVLINPASNPDGRDKMVDWFYRYLKGRTDYPALPRQSPPYWGRYVFVDANRDAHQLTQRATQAVARVFFDWHPTVIHDLHEAIALLQTWNGTGPYNPNLDPIVLTEFLAMSLEEMTAMTGWGMPGVWTWDFGEGYGHHYLDSIAMNHNAIGRGYETYGNATAETVVRELDGWETTRRWYRPWPAASPLAWSMRDNVNYTQTGLLAILDHTAKNAPEFLRNFYRKGYNSWRRGVEGSPRAFLIAPEQGDRRRVAAMIERLLSQRIEVGRAARPFSVAAGDFPAGTYVVRLDQPYRNYAVDLLRPQEFPEDAESPPYDDVSWALPVHYGVAAVAIDDLAGLPDDLEPLEGSVSVAGRVSGRGPAYLLADSGQEALLAARYRLAPFEVRIAGAAFSHGGRDYPAGSWALPPQDGLHEALSRVATELALDFESAAELPAAAFHAAPAPRLGVWVPWADTDSIGWIRYTLDQRGVPYTYLRDDDVRAGALRERVDVILYGNVDLDLQGQIHGIEPVAGPMPFTATPEYPSHGVPAASADVTGGIGWSGLAELERFVEAGGVLATLGAGSTLALDGGLVRFVRRDTAPGVRTPGVELTARFPFPEHPLAYGYGASTSVFRADYPVYERPRRWLRMAYCTSCLDGPLDPRWTVLEWGGPGEGEPPAIVSGGAVGIERLAGRPAILAVPRGTGTIVAYNFNPMHRDLNRSDYRLLWNAVLNWQRLAPPLRADSP